MKRKEIVALSILILFFMVINILNFIHWGSNRKSYALIIEEEMRQISINRAGEEQLEMLPGIGPVLARRIIEYRQKNGEFNDLEDVKKVKGIGEKLFTKIKPYIKL